MQSARMLLATAAATAVLTVTAPGAYAAVTDWSPDDSSYSSDSGGSHDWPHGGMHTGGGALAGLKADDPGAGRSSKQDSNASKGDSSWTKDGGDSWSGDHDKPRGGMHTGGGALAAPSVTAGGLAVLAVAGAGLYVVRRKKSAHGLA